MNVTGTGVQEVEVHLAGMRIRPAVLNVAPGVRLRLTVINEDTQQHDLRLANGLSTRCSTPASGPRSTSARSPPTSPAGARSPVTKRPA